MRFRAIHAGRPKLYRLALCEDMRGPMELDDAAEEEEEERIADLVMQASELRNMMRMLLEILTEPIVVLCAGVGCLECNATVQTCVFE